MTFLTMTVAFWALLNVHVTVSPASSEIEPGLEPSLHDEDASVQPAGTVSETEYVPGARKPESFC
jgi:hypothetical protein